MRFAAVFGACFLAGFGLLLTPPVQALDGWFSSLLVRTSHALIVGAGGSATVRGAVLSSAGGFAVQMQDGCNGVNVTILLWSAMLAFPAGWKMKAAGVAAGSLVIQSLNLVRFISLFYLGQYSATWFDFAHHYFWESLLILDTIVVFWMWATRVSRSGAVSHATH